MELTKVIPARMTGRGRRKQLSIAITSVLLTVTLLLGLSAPGAASAASVSGGSERGVVFGAKAVVRIAGALTPAANGDLDASFGVGGRAIVNIGGGDDVAHGMVLQPGGKFVLAGAGRINTNNLSNFALTRLDQSGKLDNTFGAGGRVVTAFNESFGSGANAIAQQADGKLVVVGFARNLDFAHDTFALARYSADGLLDPTFGNGGLALTPIDAAHGAGHNDIANAVLIAPDSKILVAGVTGGFLTDFAVARYNANGSLDTTFGAGGKVITDIGGRDGANVIAIAPDGKILVGGYGWINSGQEDFVLARYNVNGSLDITFDGGFVAGDFLGGTDRAQGIAVRPDGKIVLGGVVQVSGGCSPAACENYGPGLAQVNPDGSFDATFGNGGGIAYDLLAISGGYALARRTDGRLVLAGHFGNQSFLVGLFDANGLLDEEFGFRETDFDSNPDVAYAVAVQPDGKIVAAGKASTMPSVPALAADFGAIRLLAPGLGPTNTPTRTATATATRTKTATRTATLTKAPTRTATRTKTATRTATLTKTPTRTATRTATVARTATISKTPTRTATRTATAAGTATLTRTPTSTTTRTATRTKTPTRTATRTATVTKTPTSTTDRSKEI